MDAILAVRFERLWRRVDYDDVFVAEWLAKHAGDAETPMAEDSDDEPLTIPRRPRSYKVHARVLETHATGRYEMFRLPDGVQRLLQHIAYL